MQITSICSFWVLSWSCAEPGISQPWNRLCAGGAGTARGAHHSETQSPRNKAPGCQWDILLLLFSGRLLLILRERSVQIDNANNF